MNCQDILQIIIESCFSPRMVLGTILGMFIRVDGKPQFCMMVSIVGCILNVALDYTFVAAMGLGVVGSAVGSLTVQLITVLVQLIYFIQPNTIIGFSRFAFDKAINKEIIFNGSSEFIGEMASAISMFAFNYVLMKYVGRMELRLFQFWVLLCMVIA